MANYIDTDTVSWLPYVKPIQNPYVKIELTKEQKENLNASFGFRNLLDEPWNEANEILKKKDFLHGTLGRRNGKSDALDAIVNAVNTYEKVKEEEMKPYRETVIYKDKIKADISGKTYSENTVTLDMRLTLPRQLYYEVTNSEILRVREYVDSRPNGRNRPEIEKVIFNPPATIVIWHDKSKTVVKCREDDEYDPEYGLAMCIAKKYFGSRHQMQKLVEENYEEPDYTNIDPDSNALKEDCNDVKDEDKTTDSSVNSGNPDDHWDSDKIWGQTE